MSIAIPRRFVTVACFPIVLTLAGCQSGNAETAASPVQAVIRSQETLRGEYGDAYNRRGDDGTIVAKRVKAVLLVQLSRLKADTIAIAIHLSASSTSVSGEESPSCSTS